MSNFVAGSKQSARDLVSKEMRINLVLGHQLPFPPVQGGGVNNLLWMLARRFRQLGHSVSVCSPLAEGFACEETDQYGIAHYRMPGARMRRGTWANNLSGFPYAFHVWCRLPIGDVTSFHAPFSFMLRYRRGIGVCTHTIHRTPKWIVRLYGGMDRIYAGSHATVKEASAIAPGIAMRLKAVHNCIDVCDDPPNASAMVGSALSLIYVGRFTPDKGLYSFISGAVDAICDGFDVRVSTIGPQQDEEGGESAFFEAMCRLVGEKGVASRFRFLPSINNRVQLLAEVDKHDAFCLPSISGETFSMAGLEAMSRAKPLLTSDYGPMPEMVDEGVNGFTVAKIGRASCRERV